MEITRTNIMTGNVTTREIPVTQEQLDDWESGTLIQHAMPNLSADDREFILTGITDWDGMFDDEEE